MGFGLNGPKGIKLAAAFADEWYPIDVAMAPHGGVGNAVTRFRALAEEAGRDPDTVPITLFAWGWAPGEPPIDRLAGYADLGIERVVVSPPTMSRHDADTTRRRLDEFSPLLPSGSRERRVMTASCVLCALARQERILIRRSGHVRTPTCFPQAKAKSGGRVTTTVAAHRAKTGR